MKKSKPKKSEVKKPEENIISGITKEIQEYKSFAFGKNILFLAMMFVMTNSIQKLVGGITNYILMPIIDFFMNKTSGGWQEWKLKVYQDLYLEIGKFGGIFLEFIITTLLLYFIFKKILKLNDNKNQTSKES